MTDEELKVDYIKRNGVSKCDPGAAFGYTPQDSILAHVVALGFGSSGLDFNAMDCNNPEAYRNRRVVRKRDQLKYTPRMDGRFEPIGGSSHSMPTKDGFLNPTVP